MNFIIVSQTINQIAAVDTCCLCGTLLLIIVIFIMILFKTTDLHLYLRKIFSKKEEGERKIDIEEAKADVDYTSKKQEKISFIDKLLKKKKTCDECGSELEYREAYDSWYCPECHTYK